VFILGPIGAVLAVASVAIACKAEAYDAMHHSRGLCDILFAGVLTPVRDTIHPQKPHQDELHSEWSNLFPF
jgi:hypothetical protein